MKCYVEIWKTLKSQSDENMVKKEKRECYSLHKEPTVPPWAKSDFWPTMPSILIFHDEDLSLQDGPKTQCSQRSGRVLWKWAVLLSDTDSIVDRDLFGGLVTRLSRHWKHLPCRNSSVLVLEVLWCVHKTSQQCQMLFYHLHKFFSFFLKSTFSTSAKPKTTFPNAYTRSSIEHLWRWEIKFAAV